MTPIFTYDGAGNLTGDAQSFISAGGVTWNPYGKVMQVDILGGLTQNFFAYDAMQNRIKKRKVASSTDISTYYVRDAQGNVLAVYEKNGGTITWKEQHLYGSSRLGTVEPGVAWTTTPAATPHFRSTRILNYGWKRYEINDHLGNVRALINDRKIYISAVFQPTIIQATDYFPFGAEMRKGTGATAYRYGFNGKELDKNGEFGSLNHYDYGFRIYNPGIAKFLSVDPLTGKYPELTPYQFASNSPIMNIDLDGLEGTQSIDNQSKKIIVKANINYVEKSRNMPTADRERSFTASEIKRIQAGLNKEFNKKGVPQDFLVRDGAVVTGNWNEDDTPPESYEIEFQINFIRHDTYASAEASSNPRDVDKYNPNMLLTKVEERVVTGPNPNFNPQQPESPANPSKIRTSVPGSSSFRRLNLTSSYNSHNAAHELFHNFIHNHSNNRLSREPGYRQHVNSNLGHLVASGIFVRKNDTEGTTLQNINYKNILESLLTLPIVK